jgi:hypothetical protein
MCNVASMGRWILSLAIDGPRVYFTNMGIRALVVLVIAFSGVLARAQSAAAQPDIATLISDVRHAEDWLDQLQSFRLKMNGKSATSMLIVKARVDAAKKHDPDADLSGRPDLAADAQFTAEQAFAPQRAVLRLVFGDTVNIVVAWNGRRAVTRRQIKGQEDYLIQPNHDVLIDRMTGEMQFGHMEPHPYWWVKPEELAQRRAVLAPADKYKFDGRGNFHGTDCYALSLGLYTWFIGAADHRFYGRVRYELPSEAAREAEGRIVAVGNKFGANISRLKEWDAWHDLLPPAKQAEVDEAYEEAVRPLCRAKDEGWCENYQALGPGQFFPMKQGRILRNYESETDAELERTEFSVAEIEINPKLDNAMFVIQIPKGAGVRDETMTPARVYRPATTKGAR